MKNLFYSLVVVAFVSMIFGCKPSVEKQLAGTWTLEKAELVNIDDVAKASVAQQTKVVDDSLQAIEAKLKTAKPDAKKALEASKKSYEEQKAKISADQAKEELTKGLADIKMTATFKEDKTYEMNFAGNATTGTFTVAPDGKSITLKDKDGKEDVMPIESLEATKLVCTSTDKGGETPKVIKITFKK